MHKSSCKEPQNIEAACVFGDRLVSRGSNPAQSLHTGLVAYAARKCGLKTRTFGDGLRKNCIRGRRFPRLIPLHPQPHFLSAVSVSHLCFPVSLQMKVSQKQAQCHICNRVLRLANLRRHLNAHYGRHPYKCSYCEKGFTSKDNLRGHVASVHTGQKSHICYGCGMNFNYKGNLKTHERRCLGSVKH